MIKKRKIRNNKNPLYTEVSSEITGIGFAALGLHFNHGLGLGTDFLADIFTRKLMELIT